MKIFLTLVSIFILSWCTQNTIPVQPQEPVFSSWSMATIFPINSGEKTATLPSASIGTAVRIWPRQLLTTAHTLTDTSQNYRIRDASNNACDIINQRKYPSQDLLRIEIYGSCTGESLDITVHKINESTVNIWQEYDLLSCALLEKNATEAKTDCRFVPGMSGGPVMDTQGNLLWLIKGTDEKQGYLLLFDREIYSWIKGQ